MAESCLSISLLSRRSEDKIAKSGGPARRPGADCRVADSEARGPCQEALFAGTAELPPDREGLIRASTGSSSGWHSAWVVVSRSRKETAMYSGVREWTSHCAKMGWS